jgi:O-antigen/teichoic acid export membrane protein
MHSMSKIKRNIMWLTASQIATWSGSLVLLVVMPRHLGVEDYGAYQFVVAFMGYFTLVGMLGSNTFLVKTIARDHTTVGRYLANALTLKFVLTAALSVLAIGLGYLLGYSDQTMVLIEIGCVLMFAVVLNDAIGSALQGLQRMGNFAFWRVVQMAVGVGFGLAVLRAGHGVIAFAFAAPLGALIPLIANSVNVWPALRRSFRIDFKMWSTLIKGGAPFLLWSAILVVYGTIDIPLLKAMGGQAVVGWYTLAYAWVSMPASFSSIVVAAMMPSLSATAVQESPTEFTRLANRGICVVAFVGLPASIGIALVASDVFAFLNYQAGFEHAVPLIQILALHIPIVGMDMVLGSALIAVDRQKAWTLIACGAAILNPLLNLVAIPMTMHAFGNGAIGAAIVTVLTEVLMMIGALALRPAGVMSRGVVSFTLRSAAAAIVMIPAVVALGSGMLPLKIVVGLVTYAVASLALGTISLDGIRQSLRGRFAPANLLDTIAVPSK